MSRIGAVGERWPRCWDLRPLYRDPGDPRLRDDIATVASRSSGWRALRRRAWGYLYLVGAAGGLDAEAAALVAELCRAVGGPAAGGGRPAVAFLQKWEREQAAGYPHPLARAASRLGLDWRRLAAAERSLSEVVDRLASLPRADSRDGLAWDEAVDLVLAAAETREEQGRWAALVTGGHVDALLRPGKQRRPFCLCPDGEIGPFVSLVAEGRMADALTLAHELTHALDEIGATHPAGASPLLAEARARKAERRVVAAMARRYGDETAASALRARAMGEFIGPLRTLLHQVRLTNRLAASAGSDRGHCSNPDEAAALAVPLLYPVAHLLSWIQVFGSEARLRDSAPHYRCMQAILSADALPN